MVRRARGAGRLTAGGMRGMTTSTGLGGRGLSTRVVTGGRRMGVGRSRGSGDSLSAGRNVAAAEAYLAKLPADLSGSPLGALLLTVAEELDAPDSATSKSMSAARVMEVYAQLRELAPVEKEVTKLDDLAKRRARRLAGGARAEG